MTAPYGRFQGLTPNWLDVLFNGSATGSGGTCFGDSGSPTFRSDGSTLVVGVLTWGDAACASMVHEQRLDIPLIRDWLLHHSYPSG